MIPSYFVYDVKPLCCLLQPRGCCSVVGENRSRKATMHNASRPSQVSHYTMRKPFDGEQALAVELLTAYLKAEENDEWLPASPAQCVEWGASSATIPASLQVMCDRHGEFVLEGFFLLIEEGYLEANDAELMEQLKHDVEDDEQVLLIKGTKLLFDRLGVTPPADS